ncbi:MAG: ATP-binding cassette domain-containing protein [Chloroflexi bacterium]|nr:MAG: ATP-binding cassette domain-containing protein [Chloroflexota bacterium]
MEPLIVCENLVKIYKVASLEVVALQGLDLTVQAGEILGIVGASGSGKSTLLNIIGGLDRPSAGQVAVNGRNLLKTSDTDLDTYRRREVGFVWQQTARNLIPYLSAQDNVMLPMSIAGTSWGKKRAWTAELLHAVGLWEHREHKLAQLSGGQQQRVAIAVALANKPTLLLADEPTGELDSATASEVLTLLRQMNAQYGLTTIIVTHDPQVAHKVDRVLTIRDGRTSSETIRRVADIEAALVQSANDEDLHTHFEEHVVVDGAGRLQIPPDLRKHMDIGNRVILEATNTGILIKPIVSENGNNEDTSIFTTSNKQPPSSVSVPFWRRWRHQK